MNRLMLNAASLALMTHLVESASSANYTAEEMAILKHDKLENSIRNFDGFRGAWLGLNRGLYKQTSWKDMESKCMDSKTRNNWIEAYSVWLGLDDLPDDIDMITAFGDILLVTANLTECRFRKPVRDIRRFCNTPKQVKADPKFPTDADEEAELKYEYPC